MKREQAERLIADHAIQISKIMEEYCPHDGYLNLSINLKEGAIHFNNEYWEHAVGKIDKALWMEGGEWK